MKLAEKREKDQEVHLKSKEDEVHRLGSLRPAPATFGHSGCSGVCASDAAHDEGHPHTGKG